MVVQDRRDLDGPRAPLALDEAAAGRRELHARVVEDEGQPRQLHVAQPVAARPRVADDELRVLVEGRLDLVEDAHADAVFDVAGEQFGAFECFAGAKGHVCRCGGNSGKGLLIHPVGL